MSTSQRGCFCQGKEKSQEGKEESSKIHVILILARQTKQGPVLVPAAAGNGDQFVLTEYACLEAVVLTRIAVCRLDCLDAYIHMFFSYATRRMLGSNKLAAHHTPP